MTRSQFSTQADQAQQPPSHGLCRSFLVHHECWIGNGCSLVFHAAVVVILALWVVRPRQPSNPVELELQVQNASLVQAQAIFELPKLHEPLSILISDQPLESKFVPDPTVHQDETAFLAPEVWNQERHPGGLAAPDADGATGGVPTNPLQVLPPPRKAKNKPSSESNPTVWSNQRDARDEVVYQFILYDVGQLRGAAGEKARSDFEGLGADSIRSLVRGLNYAAHINSSCPVLVINSKLLSELASANDPELYRYAHDNIGKGVHPRAPYARVLEGTRQQIAREGSIASSPRVRKREDPADSRSACVKRLRPASAATIREKLKDPESNIRWAATRIAAARGLPLHDDLIELLRDPDHDVRQEAHSALVVLARGGDYGPKPDADDETIASVMELWRDWFRQEAELKQGKPGPSEQ